MKLETKAPAAPKSQIKAMSGVTVAVKAPQSQLALYVHGDIKGGAAASDYRVSLVSDAIREAFKGNSRALIEARTFAQGKSKRARAYAAGFDAIGIPARIQYAGKLDAPENEAARAAILSGTQDTAAQFEFFFQMVMDEKAPARPKKEAPVVKADAPASASDSADDTSAANAPAPVVGDGSSLVTEAITAAVNAVAGGLAKVDEVEALRAAIMAYDQARIDAAGVDAGAAILAAMEASATA